MAVVANTRNYPNIRQMFQILFADISIIPLRKSMEFFYSIA